MTNILRCIYRLAASPRTSRPRFSVTLTVIDQGLHLWKIDKAFKQNHPFDEVQNFLYDRSDGEPYKLFSVSCHVVHDSPVTAVYCGSVVMIIQSMDSLMTMCSYKRRIISTLTSIVQVQDLLTKDQYKFVYSQKISSHLHIRIGKFFRQ